MEKRISGFAFIGKAKDPSEEEMGDIDAAKMEGAMTELERDMAVLDEGKPDPKQMVHRLESRLMDPKKNPQFYDMSDYCNYKKLYSSGLLAYARFYHDWKSPKQND